MLKWYRDFDSATVVLGKQFADLPFDKFNVLLPSSPFRARSQLLREIEHYQSGNYRLRYSGNSFVSDLQRLIVKQNDSLCSLFETESLLATSRSFYNYCTHAINYFSCEKFYFFAVMSPLLTENEARSASEHVMNAFFRFFAFLVSFKEFIKLELGNDVGAKENFGEA